MKKILVTGFDAFNNEIINPASEILTKLPSTIQDYEIITKVIPTVRYKSLTIIEENVKIHQPEVVLMLGQAGGRNQISLERVGINLDHYPIVDNEGNMPNNEKIFEYGEDGYFATIPLNIALKNLLEKDIPASISNTAGTFVCNHVLYGTSYLTRKKYPEIKVGFIHVPYLPKQVTRLQKDLPSMELETMVKGIITIIETIINHKEDIKTSGGTIQ